MVGGLTSPADHHLAADAVHLDRLVRVPLARTSGSGFISRGIEQTLNEEVVLQGAEPVRRNAERLPTHRTLHSLSTRDVFPQISETLETERVKTGQQLGVLELIHADRTSRELTESPL